MTPQLSFFLENAWIVPALSLTAFILNGLFVKNINQKATGVLALSLVGASALFSYKIAFDYFSLSTTGEHLAIVPVDMEWLSYLPMMKAKMGTLLDPISVMMLVVVTTVSSLVHLFSIGYMTGEDGYGRYFSYLPFFTFNMLGLVLAPNIVQMFVFWELVGLSSFLLIGYYYQKPSAVSASKKAFIVTRFADLGFVIGILLLGYLGYTSKLPLNEGASILDFAVINSAEFISMFSEIDSGVFGLSILGLALILVYMGAAGKSAMFPLHIWLPDAMEGPTPVSALIHAATMVVAGVYLTARLFPAFSGAASALEVVAFVGTFTSLFAAIIACTQDDIKRVLAFSTLSQLGYLMMALGVASVSVPLGFTASMFHLFTHAFFKAALFLCAGTLIHAVHSNSIWDMGGLRKKMPITHMAFLIATLAIAGIPPFSGFFSKDEVLAAAVHGHRPVIAAVSYLVAGLTAFYMFRIYFVTFFGKAKSENAIKAHEASISMTLPLIILSIFTLGAGFIPMNSLIGLQPLTQHGIDYMVAVPATLIGVFGIFMAYLFYIKKPNLARTTSQKLGKFYLAAKNKFYFDEMYLFVTKKIIFNIISESFAWFDRHVVDRTMNIIGSSTVGLGAIFSKMQTGFLQLYANIFIIAVLVVFYILIFQHI
ncbi:MAG: NADH-quinone oxidoreductase subunit L [Halobacteriovoraceae bacterium]|jgi:NADH-quinone oxidoreductase subunit L|nr:NADH-quinone oxidoreductase subunit L [Halobacteriovoraceae bacterium]